MKHVLILLAAPPPPLFESSDLKATFKNGATCSADGIVLDGNNDYVDVDDWGWGGAVSFEVYVKYDSFNSWSRVFSFTGDSEDGAVYLTNNGYLSVIDWTIWQGSSKKDVETSNFDSYSWTHVVVTAKGGTMKVYKNGVLVGTRDDAYEPKTMYRTKNIIGAAYWDSTLNNHLDGTIAYLKMWHGRELSASDVTYVYAPHNKAHHFWDFRGCTTGAGVRDGIAGDLAATPANGPTCSASGITMDGINDFVNIGDWNWGGAVSFEVYVKYDRFNSWSRIFDFGNGASSDNVYLANVGATSTIRWDVRQGSTQKWLASSNFDSATWTHIVVTVKGGMMKVRSGEERSDDLTLMLITSHVF